MNDVLNTRGIYFDEYTPRALAELLRLLGYNVTYPLELGLANLGILDQDVLAMAYQLGRILITINAHDFRYLHKHNFDHVGIIIVSCLPIDVQLTLIDQVLRQWPPGVRILAQIRSATNILFYGGGGQRLT